MPPNNPQEPKKPNQSGKPNRNTPPQNHSDDVTTTIIKAINQLTNGFSNYSIRELVKHTEAFGSHLERNQLKTNQVRKFLDAVNRIKADLPEDGDFSKIETDVVLLKPKLAYAAARQPAAKPLSDVMSAAIEQVHSVEDFKRLVQFLESTIAYHKASGGRD